MIIGKKNRLNIPIREEKTAKEKNAGEKKNVELKNASIVQIRIL